MPSLAKAYIAIIGAAGLATLAAAGWNWSSESHARFAVLFLLTLFASTLKIKLPGFTGSVSANFVCILIGIALFSFSETVLIGFAGALVQSLWRPKRRPKLAQLFFNVSCLTICAAAVYALSHFVAASLASNSLIASMALGGCFYLVLNTGLVSTVVALAERKPLRQVWQQCYEWVFPYFLVGGAVAGLASSSARTTSSKVSLLTLPVMYLVYLYYRMHVRRYMQAQVAAPAPNPAEEEEFSLVGPHGR